MQDIPLRNSRVLLQFDQGFDRMEVLHKLGAGRASPFTLARDIPSSFASCNVGERRQAEQRRKRRQRREG